MTYYLSDENNLDRAMKDTGLALDEIEHIVGRFNKNSWRSGQLRGEVVLGFDKVTIRHAFTKKILWAMEN